MNFWSSPTYQIVRAMKATGNKPGIVAQWKAAMDLWAMTNVGPDASALQSWLPQFQVRPFYTADELAPMWPALGMVLGITDRMEPVKSYARLLNELDLARLPSLCDMHGRQMLAHPVTKQVRRFYIVERISYWSARPIEWFEFEREFV